MDDDKQFQLKTLTSGSIMWAKQVADQLERGFGASFEVAVKANSWELFLPTQTTEVSTELTEQFEIACEHNYPRLNAGNDGALRLFVPLRETLPIAVVFAEITSEQQSLAIPLAMALVESTAQQYKIDKLSARLGEFTLQVTSDFEELTWLRGLAEHINVCTPHNDLTNVAQAVLPTLREIINAECLQTYVTDPVTNRQRLVYEDGQSRCSAESLNSMLNSFATGSQRVVVRNAFNIHSHIEGLQDVTSLILAPMCRNQRHFGWLVAINKSTSSEGGFVTKLKAEALSAWEFGTFEAGLLNAAALMLTTHASNAEAFRQIEHLLVSVIRAMINVIDAKDAYTCGHSDRVALLAKTIARSMGLSELEQERIYLAGLLHDVGKIGVPDQILGKPGRLTDAEYALVKRHPEIGYAILKHVRQLHHVLPGVLYHHEAIDGSGYPHQLVGDAIPLIGRVLAVADAYDAMTSDRPYRAGMPTVKAEAILRDGAGKQWDSQVVEAFHRVIDEARAICGVSRSHIEDLMNGQSDAPTQNLDLISQAVFATLT